VYFALVSVVAVKGTKLMKNMQKIKDLMKRK